VCLCEHSFSTVRESSEKTGGEKLGRKEKVGKSEPAQPSIP
jgi:hypothetical protein